MEVRLITPEEFQEFQEKFDNANFLQTRQMALVQEQRTVFEQVFFIRFEEMGTIYGQSVVMVRRRLRIFKEAVLLQGPLFNEEGRQRFAEMLAALEAFLKTQGIARVEWNPYLIHKISNEQLETVEDQRYADIIAIAKTAGYHHSIDWNSSVLLGQLFRKNVTAFQDESAMYQALSSSLKSSLKKFKDSHLEIRELEFDDIEIFYSILTETSIRKGFKVQDFSYFQMMKEAFGEDAKYLVAFLDVEAYQQYYNERIDYFTKRIATLEQELASRQAAGKHVKKTRGLLTDATDQLNSYLKRKETFEAMDIRNPMLPLSGYLFLCYGGEVVSVFGGSYEEFLPFGGATLLNWEMMKFAKNNHYQYYNFYGTIEVDQANHNGGNFNFKRQFGGELDQLIGNFSKTLHPLLKLLLKIKKI